MKTKLRLLAFVLGLACFVPALARADEPKLEKVGATYTWAQVASWLSQDRVAVGRWDGTITVFRPPQADKMEWGPMLTQALKSPSGQGLQMMGRLAKGAFVTSNDNSSLAVWALKDGQYALEGTPKYDAKFGVANCAELVRAQGKQWLVTGHEQGYLLLWEVNGCDLKLAKDINIRSSSPIPSTNPLWNVRGVVRHKGGTVVTGGEDGDICLVSIPDGKVLSRMRYNPKAERGINGLAVSGDYLLLCNCSVGPDDKNLWLYEIRNDRVVLLDSTNLIQDTKRKQVFNFSVLFVPAGKETLFFAGTEEGLLWRGQLAGGKLAAKGNEKLECEGGAALTFEPETSQLVAVAHVVYLYKLSRK